MYRLLLYIICFLGMIMIHNGVYSQQIKDTIPSIKMDTSKKSINHPINIIKKDTLLLNNQIIIEKHYTNYKTIWFYIFSFLILSFAILKLAFPKYIQALYIITFRTSFKQKQLKEKLLQNKRASLLFNIFFVLVTGIYIALFLQNIHFAIYSNIWLNTLICITALTLIYLGKYFIFLAIGWIFHVKETITTYLFTIFSINKIISMLLLPVSILLVFAQIETQHLIINISLALLILLFLYRYLISYNIIRNNIGISRIHFFIYLCALELMPLLIAYKILSKVY